MRYLGSANDKDTTYTYGVVMSDGTMRKSDLVSALVTITMKDSYASCLSL
jgi:hypothetical protein